LYEQVSFSHTPYQDALQNGYDQQKLMDKVMAVEGIESKWDSNEVEEQMLQLIGAHK
jgi:kynurenine 3-monooxygenase